MGDLYNDLEDDARELSHLRPLYDALLDEKEALKVENESFRGILERAERVVKCYDDDVVYWQTMLSIVEKYYDEVQIESKNFAEKIEGIKNRVEAFFTTPRAFPQDYVTVGRSDYAMGKIALKFLNQLRDDLISGQNL